jgi:hypothetical protein
MKNSSNLRKSLVMLILSSLSMTVMNCSKSDSDTPTPTPTAQIVGTWKFSKFLIKEGTEPEADELPKLLLYYPCFKDVSYTFESNGSFSTSAIGMCRNFVIDSGKYEITDGKLIFTYSENKYVENVSFSGNQMTWVSSETNNGIEKTKKTFLIKQ